MWKILSLPPPPRYPPKNQYLPDCRDVGTQYLAASHASLPRWVSTKLGKALVDVAKVSWPREDPDFMTELQQLARCKRCPPILFIYLFGLHLCRAATGCEELRRKVQPPGKGFEGMGWMGGWGGGGATAKVVHQLRCENIINAYCLPLTKY